MHNQAASNSLHSAQLNPAHSPRPRWHLWKRNYDLYLGKRQFASIEGGLLAWEFVLRDSEGGVLALLDRNFQGFGKELFTDAGKYVVHFGERPAQVCLEPGNRLKGIACDLCGFELLDARS